MTCKMYAALVASLGAFALTFAATGTFARSGAAPGAAQGSVPSVAHVKGPSFRPSLRHHRGNRAAVVWPGDFYDSSYGDVPADTVQPQPDPRDIRYTYTYDVPWDWAHRYPPNVVPSDRAYVTECPEQTVTVRGKGGTEHTVNIMRCY